MLRAAPRLFRVISQTTPPSRLIHVAGSDRDKVYLRTTDDLRGEDPPWDSIPYLTLSHCWGNSNLPSLIESTFEDLTDGIAATDLPKTFRDAVQITRDLGFEYLWIDSLCIFQDSPDDWNHEASKMCQVYANAVCIKWRAFLISYTRCGLTKPADKLVALRGVAEGFARCMQLNLQEDFVAGLWLPQLGWELCWFVYPNRISTKPVQWRAPSWSWASIDSQINPGNIRHHRRCSNIVEEFSLDWSGEMAVVALHLKGKLIPATLYHPRPLQKPKRWNHEQTFVH